MKTIFTDHKPFILCCVYCSSDEELDQGEGNLSHTHK